MTESMQMINYWFQTYYADGFYLLMALFSYIYLFAHCPELRRKFLAPMAVVIALVFNPLLYQYVYSQIIYWCLFWMFPTGLLIALTVVKLVKNSKGVLGKGVVLTALCVLIVTKGANVYTARGFWETENPEKVPAAVKEVCDIMLELEEEPRCILPETLFADARQYSGAIRPMYGRDVHGYIISSDSMEQRAYLKMESAVPDYSWILQYAGERNCRFIVTYADRPIDEELLRLYKYVQIDYDGSYCIYHKA